jgi:Cu/Ag efflux pump CusA
VDFGENWISVSPEVDYDKTLDEVHKVVEYYPGLYRDVQTYLRERIKEVLTGASESIVVRIYWARPPDSAEAGQGHRAAHRRHPGDRRRSCLAADRSATYRGRTRSC